MGCDRFGNTATPPRLLARPLYGVPADVAADCVAAEQPPLWSVDAPPVAQSLQQPCGKHHISTHPPLCVGKIYVAMAARRQSERTVAPVGGNITFAYGSSERSQESESPRSSQ